MRKFLHLTLLSLFFLSSCIDSQKSTCAPNSDKEEIDTESVSMDVKKKSDWKYSETEDEMIDKPIYFAYIESENKVDFDFPYDGGSRLAFIIRESPQYGNDMYIKISKGQFNAGIDGDKIQIRFDNDEAFTIKCSSPSDLSADQLFLRSSEFDRILKLIKESKTMKIKAEFFDEGTRTFRFNIEGLEWDH